MQIFQQSRASASAAARERMRESTRTARVEAGTQPKSYPRPYIGGYKRPFTQQFVTDIKDVAHMGRFGYRGAKGAVATANVAAKVATGASLGQMGVVAGLGLAAWSALRESPTSDIQAMGNFMGQMGAEMRMATRPSFGTTSFQQSVQGLTFGLNSRRTSGWQ